MVLLTDRGLWSIEDLVSELKSRHNIRSGGAFFPCCFYSLILNRQVFHEGASSVYSSRFRMVVDMYCCRVLFRGNLQ